MRKITSLGIILILSLFSFSAKAEINFDLTSVGGILVMDYDAVSAERNLAQAERWITVVNFGNSGTSGKCGTAAKTFDIKSGRTIEFFLEKCDEMVITANIATGRGLTVNIAEGDGAYGDNITLDGTGVCVDYTVPVNKEVPVKIKVQGLTSSSSWTSFFAFSYAPKVPSISAFEINGINAAINQETKEISLEMPYGTDITAVTPTVTLGGTATSYTPTGVQDFTAGTIVYNVTDGELEADFNVNITVKATPDTEKAITALTINGKSATINESTGEITYNFTSFEGPLSNWPVVFEVNSITASADFTSGSSHDFAASNTLSITVTAQDLSTKVYTIAPTVSTKKNVAILAVNGKAESYDDLLLSAFDDYYVNFLMAGATAPADINAFYANYDLIVLHSNVGGTNATALASKAMVGVKPVLNTKAFFYNSGRWSWSTTAPGNAAAGTASADVETNLQSHPIFSNVSFTGTTLTYYDNLPETNINAIQYASDLATIGEGVTSHTIATVNTTGIQLHEIQDNLGAKFIMVGLSIENNNFTYFNSNTVNILKNAAAYLLDPSAKYAFPTTNLNTLNEKNSIYYSNGIINNPDQKSIVIYNAAGMKMMYSNDKAIDTKSMSKGIYMIQADNMKVMKFIK
jgi:hypothetical protein